MADKNNDFGENINDFEIIENLGKDRKNITLAKVRSIKNRKIYCMRKIENKNNETVDELQNYLNGFNNPHIIKYYKIFADNGYLYFIMEYIDTDLKNFIETYQITKAKVPQETIYFLLLQCLTTIQYLNKREFHKIGFRLANILMPNEKSIKIGIIKDEFDNDLRLKDDLKILYNYFVLMIFPQSFIKGNSILSYSLQFDNNKYDKKLNGIIKDLNVDIGLENVDIRLDKILEDAEGDFIKYYKLEDDDKNSSIKSVFKYFTENTNIKEKISKYDSKNELYMVNLFKNIIVEQNQKFTSIEEFKRFITFEYPLFEINKEYNPYYVIDFILKTTEKFKIKEDPLKLEEITEVNISDYFSITKKVKKICSSPDCKKEVESIEKSNIAIFDLTENNKVNLKSIKDGLNKTYTRNSNYYCDSCLTKRDFKEEISYNNFKDFIIIYLDRGKEYQSKKTIKIEYNINFNEVNNSEKKDIYKLFGVIMKEKGKEFFNFYKLKAVKYNVWILVKNEEDFKIDINKENENIIILFYEKNK